MTEMKKSANEERFTPPAHWIEEDEEEDSEENFDDTADSGPHGDCPEAQSACLGKSRVSGASRGTPIGRKSTANTSRKSQIGPENHRFRLRSVVWAQAQGSRHW
jgi:hypothetical protein